MKFVNKIIKSIENKKINLCAVCLALNFRSGTISDFKEAMEFEKA